MIRLRKLPVIKHLLLLTRSVSNSISSAFILKSTKTEIHLIIRLPRWAPATTAAAAKKPTQKAKKLSPKRHNSSARFLDQLLTVVLLVAFTVGSLSIGYKLSVSHALASASQTTTSPILEKEASLTRKVNALSRSEPERLQIPGIGVDTGFVKLGKNPDGTLGTPDVNDTKVGWYEFSPTPGELGPAVIAGHVDNFRGPAVFYRLKELNPGDKISIKRLDGVSVEYRVDRVAQFDQSNFPTQEVYGNIDHVGLRLITCGGNFDRASERYTHNVVVFASRL
jgi:LPXTG-site transpeptidase (sortase) family protein